MITALDTNILLDLVVPGAPHGRASRRLVNEARLDGTLIISEPVYAEVVPAFDDESQMSGFMRSTGTSLEPSSAEALRLAGSSWRVFVSRRPRFIACPDCGAAQQPACVSCGRQLFPRQHLIADFMVGAHALVHADVLLTRDRGYYRRYFPDLRLVSG